MCSSWFRFLLFFVVAGCGPSAALAPSAPEVTAHATHGLRVDQPIVVPKGYRATLRVDPNKTNFSGEIEIALQVVRKSSDFYLNGHGLVVQSASIEVAGQRVDLTVATEGEEWLHFQAEQQLPVGPATLHVAYEGVVDGNNSFGAFRQQAADDWYLYTQFEARGARRVFPSYDQPDLKVPWQLTLEVPAGLVALSNTPEIDRKVLDDGMVRIHFAKSPPLPSYLVAFAVGAFDLVDIGKTRSGVSVRVAAPRGRGGETTWVRESTLSMIEILEDYTGIAYPYAKLDLVSVPATGSFSAMENPGLITYTETRLLSKDNDLSFRQAYAATGAHELAHQWFGNLVTNAWWDDLWLNESFATWASAKVIRSFRPKWGSDLAWVARRNAAMHADRLTSARVIHQPVKTAGDIGAAFDHITYAKGASVLTMFEGWLGEDTFQRGIQHYLGNNQWKSLTAKGFLDAMDVGVAQNISGAFRSFIDKPGTPLVRFELTCEPDKTPVLTMHQERYRPLGSAIDVDPQYMIPVCVGYPGPKDKKQVGVTRCILLSKKTTELPLAHTKGCPEWVVPNVGGTGYYRSQLSAPLRAGLEKAPLSVPEQLVLASDLKALVYAGRAPIESMLALVPRTAKSRDDSLISMAVELAQLGRLVKEEDRLRYASWLRKNFSQVARRIGWQPRPGEASSTAKLRNKLLGLMVLQGEDRKLRDEGRRLADAWLADPTSVHSDVAELALGVGAHFGDIALIDRYVSTIKSTEDRSRRRLLLMALARVDEPSLVQRVMSLMLDTDIDVRESRRMLTRLAGHAASGPLVFEFVQTNFVALEARYASMATRLARVASAQCEEDSKKSVHRFLSEKIARMKGGKRVAAQALENYQLCLASKKALSLPTKL